VSAVSAEASQIPWYVRVIRFTDYSHIIVKLTVLSLSYCVCSMNTTELSFGAYQANDSCAFTLIKQTKLEVTVQRSGRCFFWRGWLTTTVNSRPLGDASQSHPCPVLWRTALLRSVTRSRHRRHTHARLSRWHSRHVRATAADADRSSLHIVRPAVRACLLIHYISRRYVSRTVIS